MAGFSLETPARAEDVRPAYFFYGEDLFPARQFVGDLRRLWTGAQGEPVQAETFNLAAHRWGDVLDAAKNMPFFFSPWRVLVVEGKGAGQEDLSAAEAAAFRDYFASPAPRTTIVVLFEGNIRKTKPLAKAFSALPESVARIEEIKLLKDRELRPLVAERFDALGKRVTPEAVERILDITESDFARIDSEVEKIAIYIGPKKTVEADDVTALSSMKNFQNWELDEALQEIDVEKALIILDGFFNEGVVPQLIMGTLVAFFRNLLLAKAGQREGRDPKEIFQEIKPQISEKFGGFYRTKLRQYFDLLGRITDTDILRWLSELEEMDRRIKSTGISPKEMIQAFVVSFGRKTAGRRVNSPGKR
ncbi:MAG: DNA polymerase III subunit delta [Candidatus Aminicenantes bacterium]|nr:DNA polymerase III subunit delta [Candidatus Aminicenantes bacterium]